MWTTAAQHSSRSKLFQPPPALLRRRPPHWHKPRMHWCENLQKYAKICWGMSPPLFFPALCSHLFSLLASRANCAAPGTLWRLLLSYIAKSAHLNRLRGRLPQQPLSNSTHRQLRCCRTLALQCTRSQTTCTIVSRSLTPCRHAPHTTRQVVLTPRRGGGNHWQNTHAPGFVQGMHDWLCLHVCCAQVGRWLMWTWTWRMQNTAKDSWSRIRTASHDVKIV